MVWLYLLGISAGLFTVFMLEFARGMAPAPSMHPTSPAVKLALAGAGWLGCLRVPAVCRISRMGAHLKLASAILLAGTSAALALPVGDSICEGVAIVSGQQHAITAGLVRRGARLDQINAQLLRASPGSKVELCAGTNDAMAPDGLNDFEAKVDRTLAIIKERKLRVVWAGPVVARAPWDYRSAAVDAILQRKLEGSGVRYVSIRATTIRDAGDGVHPHMGGYLRLWRLIK